MSGRETRGFGEGGRQVCSGGGEREEGGNWRRKEGEEGEGERKWRRKGVEGKKVGGRCVFGKGKERGKYIGKGEGLVYVGSHEPGGKKLKKKRGRG